MYHMTSWYRDMLVLKWLRCLAAHSACTLISGIDAHDDLNVHWSDGVLETVAWYGARPYRGVTNDAMGKLPFLRHGLWSNSQKKWRPMSFPKHFSLSSMENVTISVKDVTENW